MICLRCGVEFFDDYRRDAFSRKTPPKYCSRKCSCGMSRKKKNQTFCLRCGKPLLPEQVWSKGKYCSSDCHNQQKRENRVNQWLETGLIRPSLGKSGQIGNMVSIRSFLLLEQEGKCSICRREFMWENKPLVPVLDHIDGVAIHNGRENLRMICPNCDSQSPTYKGRNLGKGRRSLGFSVNVGL